MYDSCVQCFSLNPYLTGFHIFLLGTLKFGGHCCPKSTLVGPFTKKVVPHILCMILIERVWEVLLGLYSSNGDDYRHHIPTKVVICDWWILFFNTDLMFNKLRTTLWLSQNMLVSHTSIMVIPNILSLNLAYASHSTPAFNAINSIENVLYSTVCCWLLYQNMGAQLINRRYPVCDFLFFFFVAWDASTNSVIVTSIPLGFGMFWGIGSPGPRICSWKSS